MRTREQLKELQALPLDRKTGFTISRIVEFYNKTNGKCYVSYSGGKDSCVLLHIARKLYFDIPVVFCDTGLEYPEVKEHVAITEDVQVIRPSINFREVIDGFGYPVVSKEVAQTIRKARMGQRDAISKLDGTRLDTKTGKISQYNIPKYKYLLDAPFKISEQCCDTLKKEPFKRYEKETGRKPILGTMASESVMRRSNWMRYGCNSFDGKRIISRPMSFWTEQDVLHYIFVRGIKIPSVYGEVTYSAVDKKWLTTGVSRTGCIFCLFGLKYDGPINRFDRLKISHPKLYKYCIDILGLDKVIAFLQGAQ